MWCNVNLQGAEPHAAGDSIDSASEGGGCGDDDEPPPPPPPPAGDRGHRRGGRGDGPGDDRGGRGDDDEPPPPAGDGPGDDRGGRRPRQKDNEEVKLLREFLAASLQVNAILSVNMTLEDGESEPCFMQVLSKESKGLFVKTHTAVDDEDWGDGLFRISVQPYTRWRGGRLLGEEVALQPSEAECYIYAGPSLVDVLSVCGSNLEARHGWFTWDTRPSDVEGCVCMHNPRPLSPGMTIGSDKVPVLCLIDELERQGWKQIRSKVTHRHEADHVYDARKMMGTRAYLQCLLALPELILAGVVSFDSGRPNYWYRLLLKHRRLPPQNISAREAKRELKQLEGDHLGVRLLNREVVPLARAHMPVAPAVHDDVRPEIVGDDSPSPPCSGAEDDGEAEVVGGEAAEVVGDEVVVNDSPEGAFVAIPREIGGQRVLRVKGRHTGGWSYHSRISIRCSRADHPRCNKSRSLALDADIFGDGAGHIFLATWLAKASTMEEQEHREWTPTRADLRHFLATQP